MRRFLLFASAALWLAVRLPHYYDVTPFVVGATYWFVLASLVALGLAVRRDAPDLDFRGLAPALLIAGIIFATVPIRFRLYPDEPSLVATSYSLFHDHRLWEITQGSFTVPLAGELPARPALFPLCAALLHQIFGYEPNHVYVVNFFACIATLWALSSLGGLLTAVLVASFPIFALTFCSGQHDGLNLCLLVTYLLALRRFLAAPSQSRAELLVTLTIVAAYARYETTLLVAPTALVLLRHRNAWKPSALICVAPFLLLPVVWQRQAVGLQFFRSRGPEEILFGWRNVFPNVWSFVAILLRSHSYWYPTAPVVAYAAIVGAIVGWREAWLRRHRELVVYGALALGLILALHFSYAESDVRDPVRERYLLPFLPVIAFFAARAARKLPRPVACVTVLATFAFHLYVAAHHAALGGVRRPLVRDSLRELGGPHKMLVVEAPANHMIFGDTAVDWEFAKTHLDLVKERNRDGVFLLQNFSPPHKPRTDFAGIKLAEVKTLATNDWNKVRISRLVLD